MLSKSFTLIELLITVFIIALLTIASVPMLRQFQKRADLKMTANEIRSVILEAKNYSLAPRYGVVLPGAKIWSYVMVFFGPDYLIVNERNAFVIRECQSATKPDPPGTCTGGNDIVVLGSFKKLPKDVTFEPFNWNNNSTTSAEIRFSVEKQGEIITPFNPSTVTTAQIKIKRGTEPYWMTEVIKATGAIRVCEEGQC